MATKKTPKKSPSKRRGRKPDASSKSGKIRDLLKTGMKPSEIAKKVGCTPALVYNVKARASGRKRKAKKRTARRTGTTSVAGLSGLDTILAAVKQGEQDRTKMRRALERIRALIDDALA